MSKGTKNPPVFVIPTGSSTGHEQWRVNSHLFFFQSEYIAPCDCRRAFVSGFDGSAGESLNLVFFRCLCLFVFPSQSNRTVFQPVL